MSWLRCTAFCTLFIIYGVNPQNLLDYSVYPIGSGFLLTRPNSEADEKKIFLATASNTDGYEVTARIGPLARQAYFSGNRDLSEDPIQVLVHVVNQEVEEDTKTMNFLCHASSLQKSSRVTIPIRICCVISVNTTFSHEFTSCILELTHVQGSVVCHASIKLPAVLWKQKTAPSVTVSYTTVRINHADNHNHNHSQCSAQVSFTGGFITLPAANVVRSVPDAIREIGRSLLLQVPRRELRISEEFAVSVRLKRGDDVSDFTLRCEVPANSYVDFVRVIWPGGLKTTKEPNLDLPFNTPISSAVHTARSDGAVQNVWDIFHRSIISQKRNITEIVARFREDLARSETTSSYSPASEVYKLLFRVMRPPAGSSGRVAPRIFWSLVSLSRRNSPDRAVGGSPIVTRLNIESSELKYLAMVLKTSALVNVAALSGRPTTHPVWVYGLTHDGQLIDVTDRATCHTGDDAVIHFANDSCSKLGFSGAELDGSPGLPLVAKLDGRSATTTLLVWFPKPPALRLVIGPDTVENSPPNMGLEKMTPIRLKRLATEIASSHSAMDYGRSWNAAQHQQQLLHSPANRTSETFFQHLPIRVLARFILAGSVLYDKDVLGGKIDQYVDVTEYTAHRLRLVHNSSEDNSTSTASAELVMIYRNDQLQAAEPKSSMELMNGQPNLRDPLPGPSHVWLLGKHPGLIHLRLETLDATVLRAAIPPGLEKQLKDQQQKTSANASDLENLLRSSKSTVQMAVEITEETSVWPVGMSAQFVTDVRVKMRQSFDPGLPWDAHQTSLFRGHSNLQTNEEILPLTSGLYGIQLDLVGGRMMHSGTIHKSFGHETNLDGSDQLLHNHFRGSSRSYLLNGSRADFPRPKSSDSSGLVVVWIHLSDGSIILWHRMIELYQAMNKDMPFRLSINNLHPEVFEVTGSSIVLVERKRRGRSASLAAWDRRLRNLNENRFSRPTPRIAYGQKMLRYSSQMRFQSDSTQLDDSSPPSFADHLMSDEHTGATWSGPTVWIRRDGLSFTGDVLEMGLLSASGELLVPKMRLPANIVTPKPANDAQEFEKSPVTGRQNSQFPLNSDRIDKNSGFPAGYSPDQITENQFDSGSKKYTSGGKSINAELEETNHGLMAFKDAPGYRGQQMGLDRSVMTGDKGIVESNRKVPYAGPLHEKSLSDQNEESKPALPTSLERHQHSPDGQQGTGDGSRPALEMSMYILLGLFALVGLVFAVNCGAAVARYRWERSSRRRSANSGELVQQSPSKVADQPLATSESIPKEFTENALEAECKPIIDKGSTENVLERCKRFILPRRPKRKPLLHRDNNWVWISREKAVDVIGVSDQSTLSVSLGNPIVPNSPILTNSANEVLQVAGTGEQRKIARSQSYGTRHGTTTAVLSVGEADMLLLHSPYHKSTWQDSLRPGTGRVASYVDRSIHNTPVSFVPKFVPRSPWDSEEPQSMKTSEVHTLGRPFRHHTTETLMQRNYQGQECSIRIISNPLSDGNCGNRSDPSSQRNSEHERSSYHNTSERCGKEVWFHAANRTLMGSASASMRRRRTYNMKNSNWDSSASPLICAGQTTPIGGNQPSLFSFPNQTAPLKQGNHMTVAYGDAVMHEAVMCRSWVRPRSINHTPNRDIGNIILNDVPTQHTPVQDYSSPWHARHAQPVNKTNACASNQPIVDQMEARTSVPIKERFTVLDQLRESRELGQVGNSFSPVDYAPYPPVRTTSKATNCRTLETRGGARKSHSAPGHRPMSLPQAFQVSNDLYSILAGNTTSTSASILLDSHSQLNATDSQRHLKSNPSEESLWWYHPVRQPRRRKRRQDNKQSVTSQKPTASGPTSMETAEETVRPVDRVDSSETLEYACPASCECDDVIKCSERVDTSRGLQRQVQPPSFPGGQSTQVNMSSVSDLAWDKELLALSHDRLVAYFADMKESVA